MNKTKPIFAITTITGALFFLCVFFWLVNNASGGYSQINDDQYIDNIREARVYKFLESIR